MCESLDREKPSKRSVFGAFLLIVLTSHLQLARASEPSDDFGTHAIEQILSAWLGLNTYVTDNIRRQPPDQSFAYSDMGHLVFDVGQIVHVLDGVSSPEVTKFIIGLVSYGMLDGAMGGDIKRMIDERGDASRVAAREWLEERESPCAGLYREYRKSLLKKPSEYCIADAQWRAYLQGLVTHEPEKEQTKR